jgi:Smg protein
MFEVLVFVYENYWRGDACPELDQLGRKLSAAGFETDEIDQALQWLAGLNTASRSANPIDITPTDLEPADVMRPASALSMRIYATPEQDQLGADGLGFFRFLESAGVLPAHMREIVIDRAMAVPQRPIDIDGDRTPTVAKIIFDNNFNSGSRCGANNGSGRKFSTRSNQRFPTRDSAVRQRTSVESFK